MKNSILVQNFIEEIWNKQSFEKMDDYLHSSFTDFSLSPKLPQGKEGTKQWIIATGNSFLHTTTIEGLVSENDQTIVKIKMNLKHIGLWRGIEPTGKEIYTMGFRQFQINDGKIIGHWALIDGETIEKQLKKTL